ncbi:metal-dependent hydrolase [Bacillus sp. FJAT-44742]|uniref:metal-dependent hydrolase n=1 Tax=Bacillus sp. FJAT-44742 TaxID=2014005 RepID=UPI000C23B0DB|nr:metal-dependent hydrolase [Bacillus sp. FJAT-44742]
MRLGTHLIGATAAASAYYTISPLSFTDIATAGGVYLASSIAGGLLPDICSPRSWIGRRLPLIATIISKTFGHRTFTHSFLFLFIIYFFTQSIEGEWGIAVQTGLLVGIASHLLLDMMTSRGVHLFFPIKFPVRFPFFTKTGSTLGEGSIAVLLTLWVVYFAVTYL